MIAPGSRIAVVGGGVSGLVAARELWEAGHDVSLFEAADYAGGHTNTVEVETDSGTWHVDTGFIVYNDRNYPHFEAMLKRLGVASQPTKMSFSVSDATGGFEWAAHPRGLFARRANLFDPRFHRMLGDLVRFNREIRALVGLRGEGPSLKQFLKEGGFSDYFVERLLIPQVAAVWSADPAQMESFPASFLAEFFNNHGSLQLTGRPRWRTISGGSKRYVEALTQPFADRILLRTPVEWIRRQDDCVWLGLPGSHEPFDAVVLAVHSDTALELLTDPTDCEREVLGAMRYQPNEVVLHTDVSLMPRRRAAWGSWNYHLGADANGRAAVTYDMNRLQALVADRRFLVTLNRTNAIDPTQIIRKIEYAHPVYTRDGVAAQRRWGEISGANRTHFCGAYWRWGFHEDGVWSALRACEALGTVERVRTLPDAPAQNLGAAA